MKIDIADLLIAIRNGKSSKSGIDRIVAAINRTKINKRLLDSMHIGLSNFSDVQIKEYVKSLN